MDISVYKQAKTALKQSEEELLKLLDTLEQMAWIANPAGRVLYFNKKWYAYTGMRPGQTDGWINVVHPEDSAQVIEAWKQALSTDQYQKEYRIINGADKTYKWFLEQAEPLKDENGNVLFWFGTYTETDDDNMNTAP